jgi:hypothetical protein
MRTGTWLDRRKEPEAVELEINLRFFPPWLLQQAAEDLSRHVELAIGHLPGNDDGLLVVKARSSAPMDEILPLFRAALTHLLLVHYERIADEWEHDEGDPITDDGLTFQVFGSERFVRVITPTTQWARLVRGLASLQLSLPVVETLSPIDRVSVSLGMKPGATADLAIAEFIGCFSGAGPMH